MDPKGRRENARRTGGFSTTITGNSNSLAAFAGLPGGPGNFFLLLS